MPEGYLNISFRAGSDGLEEPIRSRVGTSFADSVHQVAKRDLQRYYGLLAQVLRRLRLSEAEASLLCDALNGTAFQPELVPPLAHEIEDAIQIDGLAEKWQIDGPAFIIQVRSWSPDEVLAVVDAVERFWQPGHVEDMSERLRTVGLVRLDPSQG